MPYAGTVLSPRENALIYLGMYAATTYPALDALEAVRQFVASIDEVRQGKRSRFLGLPDDPEELTREFDVFIHESGGEYIIN